MPTSQPPEFNGRAILAIHDDPARDELNGQTFITAEAAERYGILDDEGRQPPSYRGALGEPRIPHPAITTGA